MDSHWFLAEKQFALSLRHKETQKKTPKTQQHCPQQNKQVKYDMTAAQVAVSPVEPAHDQTWIITDQPQNGCYSWEK